MHILQECNNHRGWFVCQLSSPSISAVSTVPKSTTTTRTTTATAKQQSQPQPSSQLVGNQNAQLESAARFRSGLQTGDTAI